MKNTKSVHPHKLAAAAVILACMLGAGLTGCSTTIKRAAPQSVTASEAATPETAPTATPAPTAAATPAPTEAPIVPTSVTLEQEGGILNKGMTWTLHATVLPEDAADKTLHWTSSDEGVATIDDNGIITALAPGQTTITAASTAGEASTTYNLVVQEVVKCSYCGLTGHAADNCTAAKQAAIVQQQQQAAAQAQAAVTDAAKKAYEAATAALDAYVRAQSQRYTTADLHLTSLAFRCPLDSYGRITTQFGEPDPWGIPHRGTDFAAPGGTPIYAIADGVVSAARTMNSYGNCVQVSHGTADDSHCYDSLYAHMSSIVVAQGDTVQKGDLLGYVGNTGNVYGAGGGYHLHLELRVDGGRVNPLGYVPTL